MQLASEITADPSAIRRGSAAMGAALAVLLPAAFAGDEPKSEFGNNRRGRRAQAAVARRNARALATHERAGERADAARLADAVVRLRRADAWYRQYKKRRGIVEAVNPAPSPAFRPAVMTMRRTTCGAPPAQEAAP